MQIVLFWTIWLHCFKSNFVSWAMQHKQRVQKKKTKTLIFSFFQRTFLCFSSQRMKDNVKYQSKLLPICFQTIMIVWCLLLKHCAKLSACTEARHQWQFVLCFWLPHYVISVILAIRGARCATSIPSTHKVCAASLL